MSTCPGRTRSWTVVAIVFALGCGSSETNLQRGASYSLISVDGRPLPYPFTPAIPCGEILMSADFGADASTGELTGSERVQLPCKPAPGNVTSIRHRGWLHVSGSTVIVEYAPASTIAAADTGIVSGDTLRLRVHVGGSQSFAPLTYLYVNTSPRRPRSAR